MNDELNIFIKPIIMKKKKHDFKAWLCKRKLIKIINNTSPSFDMMVQIHQFLSIIRECYMYDNNDKFHLFLASINKNYNQSKTLAMVYKENGFSIKFILVIGENNQINIEITRYGQNKNELEKISFYDGEYEFKNIYDHEKMLFIISCLMHGVKELVEYYYNNKRF